MKAVYFFGAGKAEGHAGLKELLGSKGANLGEMTNFGIPVPPGFTISAEACRDYYKRGEEFPPGLEEEIQEHLGRLEKAMGRRFGDPEKPLLVSVRSGAAISMPGMMDTVLNLGLNAQTVEGLAALGGNDRFAFDAYRRLIQMFGNVVLGVSGDAFEAALTGAKRKRAAKSDTELDAAAWREVVASFLEIFRKETGKDFPQDPKDQLMASIGAVFRSWNNPRAQTYRKHHRIEGLLGTGVTVQAMVFGNLGDDSATGVLFTRDPATGENKLYGEFLANAQGEDVVAGIRTPLPIDSLDDQFPGKGKELKDVCAKIEDHYGEMQDIEFTIERGTLYILQTRRGQRTGIAALKIACDMLDGGKVDSKGAVKMVGPDQLNQVLFPIFDPAEKKKAAGEGRLLAKGLNAGPGAASGEIVLTADEAVRRKKEGKKTILLRSETSPEDIGGMVAAEGILTATGGITSHAAVVARGLGKCCVVGCSTLDIEEEKGVVKVGGKELREGHPISIDGSTGEVFDGQIQSRPSEVIQVVVEKSLAPEDSEVYRNFDRILGLADEFRRLGVRTNADTPKDSAVARAFGAQGIGLTRTEHMFFEESRILAFREMILADDEEGRRKALAKMLPAQRSDFAGIFRAMDGLPVTIRLLDPPLHEFLPQDDETRAEVAADLGVSVEEIERKVETLHEFNPMLGHRGCRLGITFPEIYEVQARAILEAACDVAAEGKTVLPEIMIPLIGTVEELSILRKLTEETAKIVFREKGREVAYLVGTMIEIPRAALTAEDVAGVADFFSFGTNDLTQMTYGYSRDDSAGFLPEYVQKGILPADPFQTIDPRGVGRLVKLAVEEGRKGNPKLKLGICGEHGGEPASVAFCHGAGLDYVSCSPYRVPIARLAAAHAALG